MSCSSRKKRPRSESSRHAFVSTPQSPLGISNGDAPRNHPDGESRAGAITIGVSGSILEGRAAPGYVDALDAALLGLIIPIFAQEQDQVTLRFLSYSKSANPELVELLIGEDATIEVQARSLRMHTIHDCLP